MAGDVQQQGLRDQFIVAEHVAVVFGVDERGEQVIGRVVSLPRDHPGGDLGQLGVGGCYGRDHGRVIDRLERADHRTAQLPDALVVGRRRAEHLGDHGEWQRERQRVDQVDPALAFRRVEHVGARACVLALIGGRHGKPRYVVTRKEHRHAWHWRPIVPHAVLLVVLMGSMVWSLAHRGLLSSFDVGSAYWAGLYSLLLLGFIRLSWHGLKPTPSSGRPGPVRRGPRRGRRAAAPLLARASARGHALPSAAGQASWAARANGHGPTVLASLPSDPRGTRSTEALRQLELRIGEWGRSGEPRRDAQLSSDSGTIASSAAAES